MLHWGGVGSSEAASVVSRNCRRASVSPSAGSNVVEVETVVGQSTWSKSECVVGRGTWSRTEYVVGRGTWSKSEYVVSRGTWSRSGDVVGRGNPVR